MSDDGEVPGTTFTDRLNRLWGSAPNPATGRPYSLREAAQQLSERGFQVSHAYLAKLRKGETPPPRQGLPEAIAQLFGESPDYFDIPAASTPDGRRDDDIRFALRRALADPSILRVAMRLAEAEPLSPEGAAVVLSMIERVQRLEASRHRHRQAPEPG